MQNPSSALLRLMPLYLVIFMGFVGYSLMITVFTPMIMQNSNGIMPADSSTSVRVIILGILLSLYPLGQFFASSVMGAFSDRFGRKPILLITLIFSTIFYILIAVSLMIPSLTLLMIASLVAGLSEANIAIAQSAISDVTTAEKRTHYFGYIYLSASSAYIIGPLVGGKLAASFNNATPFWCVVVLLVLSALWIQFKFKETKTTPTEKLHYLQAFTNLWNVIKDKRLRPFYGINFLLYLAIFGFFRCYPMYLVDQFHMNVSKESEYIAWVAVPIILANLGLTGLFARRISPKYLTIYSAIFTGIWMIIIVFPLSLWMTLFLTSLGLAICLPACSSMLSIITLPEEQGRVMGNNQSLQVGAEGLSGIIGGLLAAIYVKLSLIVLGIVALIAALLLFFEARKPKVTL